MPSVLFLTVLVVAVSSILVKGKLRSISSIFIDNRHFQEMTACQVTISIEHNMESNPFDMILPWKGLLCKEFNTWHKQTSLHIHQIFVMEKIYSGPVEWFPPVVLL